MSTNSLRVVFVGPFGLQPKGTMSVRALPMAKALVQRGHTVTMLIPPWDDPARAKAQWVEDGVQIIHTSVPLALLGWRYLSMTWQLVRHVLALKPDVVHCFKPKAYAGLTHTFLWGLRVLRLNQLKLVVDADDWEQAWNEVSPYTERQKQFFVWQEEWGLSNADVITVASRTLERLVRRERAKMDTAQRKIFYVPNGSRIPLADIPPVSREAVAKVREKHDLGGAPTVLLYTRFGEFRFNRIITLVWYISEYLPEARWLIVGKGLRGEEEKLNQELSEGGLMEYVRFAGWVPTESLNTYFHAAHVAVHPYDDTLINRTKCSVKLIDLLSVGLPVVADAVGQNVDYIVNEQSGILIPPEDDAAFGEAVVSLLNDPERRGDMVGAAQAHIQQNFEWSHLVETVEQAYQA